MDVAPITMYAGLGAEFKALCILYKYSINWAAVLLCEKEFDIVDID